MYKERGCMKNLVLLFAVLLASNNVFAANYSIKCDYKMEEPKCGIVNMLGKYVVEPVFDNVYVLFDEGFIHVIKDKKHGLYSEKTLKEVIPPLYDDVRVLDKNYIVVYKSDKCALFDTNKKQLTGFDYDGIERVANASKIRGKNEQLFAVTNSEGKLGVIDVSNNLILPFEFDKVLLYGYYLVVTKDGKKGLFDRKGYKLYDANYQHICVDMSAGYVRLYEKDYKWDTYDIPEEVLIEYEVLADERESVLYRTENGVVVQSVNKEEMAKLKSKVIPATREGLKILQLLNDDKTMIKYFAKKENRKYFLMDNNRNVVNEEPYDAIDVFGYYKYIKVKKGEYYSVLDKDLTTLFTVKANEITQTVDCDYFIVYTDDGFVAYDINGEKIQDLYYEEYEAPEYVSKFYQLFSIITVAGGKKGVLDNTGKLIIPAVFDEIDFQEPVVVLKKSGKYGYYHLGKKFLSESDYDSVTESVDKNGRAFKIFSKNGKQTKVK